MLNAAIGIDTLIMTKVNRQCFGLELSKYLLILQTVSLFDIDQWQEIISHYTSKAAPQNKAVPLALIAHYP